MRYVKIPHTDLRVSALCMGSGEFGSSIKQDGCFELLDLFYLKGGTFIDTALIYGDWAKDAEDHPSERIIGRWIKDRGIREKIIIGTKGGLPRLREKDQRKRIKPDDLMLDIDTSVDDLQVDTIDLYWLHTDDESVPVEEIIDTLESAKEAGKIRWYGSSNWKNERLFEAQHYAEKKNVQGFIADQILWNAAPIAQPPFGDLPYLDKERYDFHKETGMAMISFQSQAYGLFNRMFAGTLDQMNKGFREFYKAQESAERFDRMKKVMADSNLESITQLVLGYLTSQTDFTTVPIFSSRNTAQLTDTLTAADVVLTPEQLAFIDDSVPWAELAETMAAQ